ncbi:hypothetical protein CWM88_15190 [Klebsiella pneumoniae]|nr:hypothetical protein CWM88_15190 [Klebsiella pneumoniae]
MVTGGSRKHTVLRQRQKYTRSLQFAQFKVGFLCHRVWMRGADLSKKHCSSIQYLSILGVFTLCHSGAASLTGATKSWLKRVVPSVP